MKMFENLQLKWKLGIGFAIPLLMIVTIATIVSADLEKLLKISDQVNHTYEAIDLGDKVTGSLVSMESGLRGYLLSGKQELLEPYTSSQENFNKLMAEAKHHVSDDPIQVARLIEVERLEREWQAKYVETVMRYRKKATPGASTFEKSDFSAFIGTGIGKKYMDQMRGVLHEFVADESKHIVVRNAEQKSAAAITTNETVFGAIFAVLIGAIVVFYITRVILRQLGADPMQLKDIAEQIAEGKLDFDISSSTTSGVQQSMAKMRENLLSSRKSEEAQRSDDEARVKKERVVAADNQRIKISLDAVTANVMIADAGNNIVYMNKSLTEMMTTAEADIRKDFPNFSTSKLMGTNMDVFHKNPAHQQGMINNLTGTFSTDIEVGGRTFGLVATVVMGADGDRLGTAVEWQDKTEQLARELQERQQAELALTMANENARVKISLDAVTANVMIADENNQIVYMNSSLSGMFQNAQTNIRQHLPNFDANKLLGANMDIFHENPAHQQNMIRNLSGTFKTDINVGSSTFTLVANAVFNDQGQRLGTAVEWTDLTLELAVENEVASIVSAAANGDLSQRIDMHGKEGFFKVVGEGINNLTQLCDNVMKDTIRVLGAMAQGDLTEKINADYQGDFQQLKNDANATTQKFIEIIGNIQLTADSVYTGSTEISAGNDSLSQRTEEQASSLEETASSMEEMTGTIKQNADNANQANQLAAGARDQAEKGGRVVQNAIKAMEEINVSSKKVADIIGVIDEIAFQTNLLALNAAVEAARAGEQGRGFAVVASEVRNLAQRSATAAKEIKELIQDSVGKVEEGSRFVDETGATLEEIVTGVKKVSDIIAEIAAASVEQSSGIDQVNKAVMQLDEMTQQNAALVEQASATSKSMSDEAQNLNNLMRFFETGAATAGVSTSVTTIAAAPQQRIEEKPRAVASAPVLPKKMSSNSDWNEF